tara:strand:- start:96 stop:362 length:267 start_codon:yes stop_codon:yes gene_type:complete
MVDTDIEDLLNWWYNKPVNWAGTYKEDNDGVVTLTLFKRPAVRSKEESIDDQLQRARGRAPKQEYGGYDGPDPTTHGDWQHNGRCTDF